MSTDLSREKSVTTRESEIMIGCRRRSLPRSLSDKYVQPSAIAAADAYVGENMYAVASCMPEF